LQTIAKWCCKMEKTKILFFHTSPAAINPLKNYYQENAPELEIINFLDDGILEFFTLEKSVLITQLMVEWIKAAQNYHQVKACLITCSAVTRGQLNDIGDQSDIPVLKVDLPMLESAIDSGERIGIIASFPPGAKSSMETLYELAHEKEKKLILVQIFKPEAYDALLQGNISLHDQLILKEIEKNREECDAYVLTQVSLAHLKEKVEKTTRKPVFASPQESLTQIRRILNL
jgi:glutamate racemase